MLAVNARMSTQHADHQAAAANASTRVQYRTVWIAQFQGRPKDLCDEPQASGSFYLPAPIQQQTPALRGGETARLPSAAGVSQHDRPGLNLPVPQHSHQTASGHAAQGEPAAMASITATIVRDGHRLSAYLDQWTRRLGQRVSVQEAAPTLHGQLERRTRRRRHADAHGREEHQPQRPERRACFASIRGGGGGPQPAAGRDRQGSEVPAAASKGVPSRYSAVAHNLHVYALQLSLHDRMLCKYSVRPASQTSCAAVCAAVPTAGA